MRVQVEVREHGPHVPRVPAGTVAASGPGWVWLATTVGWIHLCGPRGPRSPLTAVSAGLGELAAGTAVDLAWGRATSTDTPVAPPPVAAASIAACCDRVADHGWQDPIAKGLTDAPLGQLLPELIGRGPGLTPAGDDVVCGYLAARAVVDPAGFVEDGAAVRRAVDRTSEPSRSLLLAAADHGVTFRPAMRLRDAVLAGRHDDLPAALRALTQLGSTTGRAVLTGIVAGLRRNLPAAT